MIPDTALNLTPAKLTHRFGSPANMPCTGNTNLHIGFSQARHWLLFEVVSVCQTPVSLVVEVPNPRINYLEFWAIRSNGEVLRADTTGDLFSFSRRPLPTRNFTFPLLLAPHDTVRCFLLLDKHGEVMQTIPVTLSESGVFYGQEQVSVGLLFALLALMGVVAVTMLILAALKRQSLFMIFSFHIILYAYYMLNYTGFAFPLLWAEFPEMNKAARSIFIFIYFPLFTIFIKQYIKKYMGIAVMRHWVAGVSVVSVLLALAWPFPAMWPHWIERMVFVASLPLLTIVGTLAGMATAYKTPAARKELRWLMAAYLSLFVAIVMAVLVQVNLLDKRVGDAGLYAAFLIEIAIIATRIFTGIAQMQRQQVQLQLTLAEARADNLRQLMRGQEAERRRIGSRIHDELGGLLAALYHQLDQTGRKIGHPMQEIDYAKTLAKTTQQELREISHQLQPVALERWGLATAIESHLAQLDRAVEGCTFDANMVDMRRFSPDAELAVYRMVLELVGNALRHAKATQVGVTCVAAPADLRVWVQDNGIGLPATVPPTAGMGLQNVRGLVGMLNGQLEIESGPGKGTLVYAKIPIFEYLT